MSQFILPYAKTSQPLNLPDGVESIVLEPEDKAGMDHRASVEATDIALEAQGSRFRRPVELSDDACVAIAVNDKTRPVPHAVLIPSLLQALESWGWQRREVLFIIAVGAHTPTRSEEYSTILPDGIADGCRIMSHDSDDENDLVSLGETALGTPCRVNRLFADADLRIVVGNIEPHQFMGWSGGVKSASIGLASRQTIAANHSMMAVNGAGPCRYEDNPVRQDVEELGRMIGVDLALNVVMNRRKEIVSVLAGNPVDVMKEGIEIGSHLFTAPFTRLADLVVVSPGGYPKDINLYQAQKALRHGARAARPGAPVILLAACSEGVGSRMYESWMQKKSSHEEVKEAFESEEFRLGHHKGMLFAADAIGREVFLVSELSEKTVSGLLLTPADSLESALSMALKKADNSRTLRVAILPYGNATIPVERQL